MDNYKYAAEHALRFPSPQGSLMVEDLFHLPLQTTKPNHASLDSIAIAIDTEIKQTANTSFVDNKTGPNPELKIMLEIVVDVIETRKAQTKAKADAAERAGLKQKIDEIIASKQDEKLMNLTVEELQKKRDEL